MPPDYSRYQYDPSLLAEFFESAKPALLDFTKQQKKHGGVPRRNVEDIYSRLAGGKLKAYALPEELYKQKYSSAGGQGSSGGFHGGDEIFMRGLYGDKGIAHEFGHELYGHQAGAGGVPKLNLYEKLDRRLKGWLPSSSKYGEFPSRIPIEGEAGYSRFKSREAYNKRMREGNYHPQFADAPFEVLEKAMWNLQDQSTKDAMLSIGLETTHTKGGDYTRYDPRSLKAKDFRGAFREARKSGLKEFDWDERKYSTALA